MATIDNLMHPGRWRNTKTILLSPHSDDVCFSLGVFAKSMAHVCVINIFTTSGYLPGMHGLDQTQAIAQVSSIRESEDRAFATEASLERVEGLGLLDAPLRGLEPLSAKPMCRELDYVGPPLAKKLREIWGEFGQGALLLAPAGIGEHVDHLTIRDWVIENYPELSSKYQLGFYEDLHYASDPEKRRKGIEDLLSRIPDFLSCSRIRVPIDENGVTKLELLTIYRSQFPGELIDLHRFIPAEHGARLPHEAFWIIRQKEEYPHKSDQTS